MYHHFVAGKVRHAFAQISAGDYEAMIAGMAPTFRYRFYGEHALSGERHTHDALRRWWQRNFRLMREPVFEVQEVIVSGWPWRTTVATVVEVHAQVPGAGAYDNVFMQFMKLRWGRIADVRTLEDTARLVRTLDAAAAAGIAEAHAAPITDGPATG